MSVREITSTYTMGQEEPSLEVFNPQSRHFNTFLKKRVQHYIYSILEHNNNLAHFIELHALFPGINEQIFKKTIKEIGVEENTAKMCYLRNVSQEKEEKMLLSPEQICQYEAAIYGLNKLHKFGIMQLVSPDKLTYAVNKFNSEVILYYYYYYY